MCSDPLGRHWRNWALNRSRFGRTAAASWFATEPATGGKSQRGRKALSSDRQTTDRASEAIEDVLHLAAGTVEWRLDRSDIEKLESAGRERRCSSNQTPDPHATSQVLRATGEIVDQRLGRLLRITKEGHIVNLNYLSSSGQTVSDDYSPATLYDFWVRMYKRRSSIDSSVLE